MSKWAAALTAIVATVLLVSVWQSHRQNETPRSDPEFSPLHLLSVSADDGFTRPPHPWEFTFPADHARHSEYRTEWWHVMGTVADGNRSRLGVQFLLVRIGLTAQPEERQSRWAASEIYAGLFSASDPFRGRLRTGQRLSRGALELAGTATGPLRIWVEDWRLEAIESDSEGFDLRMQVATDDLELELELHGTRPLIDTNDISDRSTAQTAPFQFYLQPHLRANGTLRIGGREIEVAGSFSMEHAWGELPLPGGPVAQDRFTLHLDDERVLVGVQTHRADGSGTPDTTGLLIGRDGQPQVLPNDEIALTPTGYWRSPRTDVLYPISWLLRIPSRNIELELTSDWEDQEGDEWVTFWAGPVGTLELSTRKRGSGFVQLNGYGPR